MKNKQKKKIQPRNVRLKHLCFWENRHNKGRDNKDYYDGTGGGECGYHIRVPSLTASTYTWKHFYKLFPEIKQALIDENYRLRMGRYRFKEVKLIGNVYVTRDDRIHGEHYERTRLMKFKKVW